MTAASTAPSVGDNAPEVIVYGTVCLDQFLRVDAGGSPLSEPFEMPGGEAFNTAVVLAGWGVRVLLTGTALGSDRESDRLRALLDDPVVGLSRRRVPDLPNAVTPVCTVRVFPDGERMMQGRGYRDALAPPPLPDTDFAACPVFAVDPNLGTPATEAALRAASRGCPVVAMDFQQVPEVVRAACLVQTSREGLARFPLPRLTNPEPEEAARHLAAMGARIAIVTDGARGGAAAVREGDRIVVQRYASTPVPKVLDTTGAGDVFRAGLCWGLLPERGGCPLPRLLRIASAAAALHCQTLGGGSRPPLEAVLRLAETPA
ncbi:MAG: carbohydrate kinase family protein [Cytophagales bacterium]|nr:carbohydrate kinase family protein [Armatimonadota bacterium]